MIMDIFGGEELQKPIGQCMNIVHLGFKPRDFVEDICFLFGHNQKMSISKEENVECATKSLVSFFVDQLRETKS